MNEEDIRKIVREEICNVLTDIKAMLDECIQQKKTIDNKNTKNKIHHNVK